MSEQALSSVYLRMGAGFRESQERSGYLRYYEGEGREDAVCGLREGYCAGEKAQDP